VREEYREKVNSNIANDSVQHRGEGKMLDAFQDLSHHRNEGYRVCDECDERGSDFGGHKEHTEGEDRYLEGDPDR